MCSGADSRLNDCRQTDHITSERLYDTVEPSGRELCVKPCRNNHIKKSSSEQVECEPDNVLSFFVSRLLLL